MEPWGDNAGHRLLGGRGGGRGHLGGRGGAPTEDLVEGRIRSSACELPFQGLCELSHARFGLYTSVGLHEGLTERVFGRDHQQTLRGGHCLMHRQSSHDITKGQVPGVRLLDQVDNLLQGLGFEVRKLLFSYVSSMTSTYGVRSAQSIGCQ